MSSQSVDRLARRLSRVEKDVFNVGTQPRLPFSSIDGGSLALNDQAGNPQGVIGQQWDGTNTFAALGGTPPAPPTAPLVTAVVGGLTLYWDGTYEDDSVTRMDFKRVTFHAVLDVDDFDAVDAAQIVGEITTATGGEVSTSLPPEEYFIFAVAWTDSGKFSVESQVAWGTPLDSVDPVMWAGHEQKLSDLEIQLAGLGEGGNLGELSDLVALISQATGTKHLLY